jgi:23S rRNA (guanosine2251-2'-O)-methyltransferase
MARKNKPSRAKASSKAASPRAAFSDRKPATAQGREARPQGKISTVRGAASVDKSNPNPSNAPESAVKLSRNDSYILYGRNSVFAALANPKRECLKLFGTAKALEDTPENHKIPRQTITSPDVMRSYIPNDAPHQGLFLEVRPLPSLHLDELSPITGKKNIILMLDQVTDPHNVGACLRTAAAFGARAVITQDRNSPTESGVLARASAGGLENVPWLQCTNLSQALDTLKDMGYWHVGLDGHTNTSIKNLDMGDNIVIVMGSEGKGLRPLVRKQCDEIAKIPMSGLVESLNVSNAAAIALFALS